MGGMRLEKGFMTAGYEMGKIVVCPVQAYVVIHPKGNLLLDTGMHIDCIDKPEERWGDVAKVFVPVMKKGQDIVSQLAKIGMKPDDINILTNSHLHLDHAGGNGLFPKAKCLVQRNEIRSAYYPEIFERGAYIRKDFDYPANFVEIDGDYDVFGDGKVQLIFTPGHSQGHQSLQVDLKNSGRVVFTGDACDMRDNIDLPVLLGFTWNPVLAMKNIMRFRDMEQRGVKILVSHDPDAVPKYKLAPEYYD